MAVLVPQRPSSGHGTPLRGLDSTVNSPLHQGRFGRMFSTVQPTIFTEKALTLLAQAMTAAVETNPETGKPSVTPEADNDDEENFGIPAGYTYFGQFIDHDITFDPTSLQEKLKDPDGLVNFRTPALDLDNLYGRGPTDQPYLFDEAGRKFRLGDRFLTGGKPSTNLTKDLPRFHERALIGDKRNDENVIVSQLHGLFMRLHNRLADKHPELEKFEQIQKLVRWHYQWLVVFDFLPHIVGRLMVSDILPQLAGPATKKEPYSPSPSPKPNLHFYDWKNDPFMPVEFSVAAYRFGHSMVRPVYRLSAEDLPSETEVEGLDGRKMIFSKEPNDGLNGFREFPANWGIDWELFFETPGHQLSPANTGPTRVQPAYKIDTSLVSPLAALPEFSIKGTNDPIDETGAEPPRKEINILALRNLIRSNKVRLPSGQAVAHRMGLIPLTDNQLRVGKANTDGIKDNKSIADISPEFVGHAPLWFYILAEAQNQWVNDAKNKATEDDKNNTPVQLGPVGGRIVAEVLIGLLWGDGTSFLRANPNFKPEFGNPAATSVFERFTMGDLVMELKNQPLPND